MSSPRFPALQNPLGVMAVTALSRPEMIIFRRVLKVKLLAVYTGIMTITIIGMGYLFNSIR
jgi:uncharacterized protein